LYGQLGNGTTANFVSVPVQVVGLTNPAAISAGYTISLARMSNGTVQVWGTDRKGELGQGTFGAHAGRLPEGSFQFDFTNNPGASFTVLASSNLSSQFSSWTPLAGVTEVLPGQFQFTDPQATNTPMRFYRIGSNL
jgi:hypothetical protein